MFASKNSSPVGKNSKPVEALIPKIQQPGVTTTMVAAFKQLEGSLAHDSSIITELLPSLVKKAEDVPSVLSACFNALKEIPADSAVVLNLAVLVEKFNRVDYLAKAIQVGVSKLVKERDFKSEQDQALFTALLQSWNGKQRSEQIAPVLLSYMEGFKAINNNMLTNKIPSGFWFKDILTYQLDNYAAGAVDILDLCTQRTNAGVLLTKEILPNLYKHVNVGEDHKDVAIDLPRALKIIQQGLTGAKGKVISQHVSQVFSALIKGSQTLSEILFQPKNLAIPAVRKFIADSLGWLSDTDAKKFTAGWCVALSDYIFKNDSGLEEVISIATRLVDKVQKGNPAEKSFLNSGACGKTLIAALLKRYEQPGIPELVNLCLSKITSQGRLKCLSYKMESGEFFWDWLQGSDDTALKALGITRTQINTWNKQQSLKEAKKKLAEEKQLQKDAEKNAKKNAKTKNKPGAKVIYLPPSNK